MSVREATYCNRCKRLIVFIQTEKGKLMPCEASAVPYLADERGDKQILTDRGKLVRCRLLAPEEKEACSGFGFVPHFSNCVSREAQERLEAYKRQGGSGLGAKAQVQARAAEPQRPERVEPEVEQMSLFAGAQRRYQYPG